MEVWVKAPGHEEDYAVSDEGRVKRTSPGKGAKAGRMLKAIATQDGYTWVRLHKEFWRVHRLVATAFLGKPPFLKAEVNHKDGCRSNNRTENLEWVSRSENLTHAIRVLGRRQPRGERHGMSKLTAEGVIEMRRLYAAGEMNQIPLARRFGVSQATVWRIVNRTSWRHVA